MTQQKAVVERYTDGFRTAIWREILSCLTDDVVWELHGAKTLVGKEAFAAEADGGGGRTRSSRWIGWWWGHPQATGDAWRCWDTAAGNSATATRRLHLCGGVHVHRRS